MGKLCQPTRLCSNLPGLDCIQLMMAMDAQHRLCENPSLEETREAVFGIDLDSVAGPDGFGSKFY